jgi:hypothetical protein
MRQLTDVTAHGYTGRRPRDGEQAQPSNDMRQRRARVLAWLAASTASDEEIAERVGLDTAEVADLRRRLAT